jgi:hypothetical protein
MRPDNKQLQEIIAEERIRDPENAKREFDCDTEALSTGSFFDQAALRKAVSEDIEFLPPSKYPVACAVDFAFKRDSSTICVVQFDGNRYNTVHVEEIIPKEGQPLKPSEVVERFAHIAKEYQCGYVIADSFYREAVRENLQQFGLSLVPAPDGAKGKMETYLRTKAMLDDGRISIPNNSRMITQACSITAKPTSGGLLTIRAPRRAGFGHGDIVSSWVLAVHHLSYSRIVDKLTRPIQGEPGYTEWFTKQLELKTMSAEDKYVRSLEKSVKHKPAGKRWS